MFPVRTDPAFYRRFTGVWRRVKRDLVEMQLVPAFVANVCMWIWLDEPIVESGLRAALFLFPILAVADRSVSIRIAIGSWRDGCSEGAPMSSTEPADAAYQLWFESDVTRFRGCCASHRSALL